MTSANHAFVDAGAMATARGHVQDAYQKNQQLKDQVQQTQTTLQQTWEGEASTMFGQAITNWITQFERVQKSLTDISDQLDTNRANYISNEGNQTDNASQLKSILSQV